MSKMETIQIGIPSELAQRLRPHRGDLPSILEWGLRRIEEKPKIAPSAPTRADVLAALRSTGILVELDPTIAARYRAHAEQQRQTPVQVNGKPLSEIIIEERDRQWSASQ